MATRVDARGCTAVFLTVWTLGWTAGTLFFTGMLVKSAVLQIVALGHPTVAGTIATSEIEVDGGTDGDSHRLAVTYRYEVGGLAYTGDVLRHGDMGGSEARARRLASRYPVGAPVTVRYDPDDPANAVLEAGLDGMDLFLGIFLTPFVVIMLGGWMIGWAAVRPIAPGRPPPGARVHDRGGQVRVRFTSVKARFAAMAAAGGVAFVSIFVLALATGMDPPIPVGIAVWCIIATAAITAYVVTHRRDETSGRILEIDMAAGTLSLGQGAPHAASPIDLEQIEEVRTEEDRHPHQTSRFATVLRIRDARGHVHAREVASWWRRPAADAMTEWLQRFAAPQLDG